MNLQTATAPKEHTAEEHRVEASALAEILHEKLLLLTTPEKSNLTVSDNVLLSIVRRLQFLDYLLNQLQRMPYDVWKTTALTAYASEIRAMDDDFNRINLSE